MSGGSHPELDQAEYNNPADSNEDDTKNLTDEYRTDVNNYLPSYEETCVSTQPCIPADSNSCSTSNEVPKNFDSLNQHLTTFESTLEVVSNNEEGFKESCLYKSSVQYSEMNVIPQEPKQIIIEPQDRDMDGVNFNGQSLTAEPVLNIRGVSHNIFFCFLIMVYKYIFNFISDKQNFLNVVYNITFCDLDQFFRHLARKIFRLDSWSPGAGVFPIGTINILICRGEEIWTLKTILYLLKER